MKGNGEKPGSIKHLKISVKINCNMEKRRDFIKKSLAGTAGIAIGGMGLSARSYASIMGSNERLTVAAIGVRGQGRNHIQQWVALKENRNVFLKTICDVD